MVNLFNVRFGKQNSDVKTLQEALIAAHFSLPKGATGTFDDQTRSAYAAWQGSLGFHGKDADGNPGCGSLTKLGHKAGFAVDCRNPGAITAGSVRFTKNHGIAQNIDTARDFAKQACKLTGAPSTWVTGVGNDANMLTLILRESSYNPNAVNKTDSNATGTHQSDGAPLNCSRGYAQVIATTFADNHQAGTSDQIYDPVANISAAINYIWNRYGDISHVQQANPHLKPHGY
ncbi:transglycosylase SLT domain-containing protein [Streptomyces natalensis]|uniref:transglycosylase SLT domain-containing protein n=1 Tax=Streptomyces natalensis TaxID=68242 RepID=UPI00068DD689|nr:transglycosylase SLT domain-containing protein [Streptomyces natalensis]